MMVTGGTSNKRIPQFNDAIASFDCADATALHMAHPWANSPGALTSANAKAPAARMHHCFVPTCFIGFKAFGALMSERPFLDIPLDSHLESLADVNPVLKTYQGFIRKSRTLSGKNTESVDATTTRAGINVNTNVRFSKRKCMKYAMMSAALTNDSPIKRTSITVREN